MERPLAANSNKDSVAAFVFAAVTLRPLLRHEPEPELLLLLAVQVVVFVTADRPDLGLAMFEPQELELRAVELPLLQLLLLLQGTACW